MFGICPGAIWMNVYVWPDGSVILLSGLITTRLELSMGMCDALDVCRGFQRRRSPVKSCECACLAKCLTEGTVLEGGKLRLALMRSYEATHFGVWFELGSSYNRRHAGR